MASIKRFQDINKSQHRICFIPFTFSDLVAQNSMIMHWQ